MLYKGQVPAENTTRHSGPLPAPLVSRGGSTESLECGTRGADPPHEKQLKTRTGRPSGYLPLVGALYVQAPRL